MEHPRSVDEAIARFDEVMGRIDRSAEARAAQRRVATRTLKKAGTRALTAAGALAALMIAVVAYGVIVGPIGIWGFLMMLIVAAVIAGYLLLRPGGAKRVAYSDQLPTGTIVRQLEGMLVRERPALPAPAAQRVDAISKELPLLESRLTELDPLDPLAQDARRLMGKHLPELIERYERVPPAYRQERDGDGLTVDERLVAGLEAARQALGDIGGRIAKQDLSAFETQGRFLESRYKDGETLKGE